MAAAIAGTRNGSRGLEALRLHGEGLSWAQVAVRMGVKNGATVAGMARYARKRGGRLRFYRGLGGDEDEDLAHIDTTPGCEKCGLRGEHECVGRAETFLGRRDDPEAGFCMAHGHRKAATS